jgi:3'(2'), 5'-bisphosphate nucleotidase
MLMQKPDLTDLWEPLETLIRQAGEAIMKVYKSGNFELELKDDKFPLTKADMDSHRILMDGLNALGPGIRIMSEESLPEENADIVNDHYYWCIDPLDGTAEFAHKRDQFVVNIGLIGPEGPVAGMVYAPVFDDLYWGEVGVGAWMNLHGRAEEIIVSDRTKAKYVVGSISHLDEKSKAYIDKLGDVKLKQYGSALKLTAVACGQADIYPRFAPTMEWDTAAPHAIVTAAGGKVLGLDGKELKYRKPELRNPGFICYNGKLNLPDFKVK